MVIILNWKFNLSAKKAFAKKIFGFSSRSFRFPPKKSSRCPKMNGRR